MSSTHYPKNAYWFLKRAKDGNPCVTSWKYPSPQKIIRTLIPHLTFRNDFNSEHQRLKMNEQKEMMQQIKDVS
jgi:hypothetical protein